MERKRVGRAGIVVSIKKKHRAQHGKHDFLRNREREKGNDQVEVEEGISLAIA